LILGSDSLRDLPQWRQPEEIAALASLLVVPRPDAPVPSTLSSAFRVQVVNVPLMDLSSSDLRRRCQQGRSLRYLTPRAVECYIETHKLYSATGQPT